MRRRFVTLVGGGLGLAYLLRRFRRHPVVVAPTVDPAAELRRKLDEAKPTDPSPEPEHAVDDEVPTLDDRRREVHGRARAAIDELGGQEGS